MATTIPKSMSREFRSIITHAQALVDATTDEVDDRVKSARDELAKRLDDAKEEYGVLKEHLREDVRAADELIHAKPYYAIGGTFVAGLLLGWLMSRK
ncbi:protein of unknown function DUF883 ElaB [Desulfovibrio sp. X2]|uniref:DUF883 family protein n=1 Tax=Desulfovibrio sp. X2 TaxID=941449 RepID=UPI000358E2A4|nr:DUF883 family protein [Desulfovibrio sp. X2]EPR41439.1 protein of unknown function DUF883 ElaB [Desulfovibrio sp. X2]